MKSQLGAIGAIALGLMMASCQGIDNDRIPNMPVNIKLTDPGLWNTYGVSGFGSHRNFIYNPGGVSVPTGFSYNSMSATGFGGVLLIEGVDPLSAVTAYPLAYDLACPVERKASIKVSVENETYMAVCPECNSVYDVTMGNGAPISGEAITGKYKYKLKSYRVLPGANGGYLISN
ncbi:MAG: hypothetical protein J1D77_07790 [Muribaculaceae bacterium]|nr:hypothetical protein [Muribaculaceae bacterium]